MIHKGAMKQVRTLKSVNCPTCAAIVEWTPAQCWRPFCSERCKLIDLGSWFDESNRIPAADPLEESDYGNHPEV